MANYHIALQEVLKNEGGYVNDPDDSGGETYKGIARRFHPDWIGWAYIDKRDFKNPNLNKLVSDFYYIKFWELLNIDGLVNQEIATSIFDFAVNAGVKTSAILAQKAADIASGWRDRSKYRQSYKQYGCRVISIQFCNCQDCSLCCHLQKKPKKQEVFFWMGM